MSFISISKVNDTDKNCRRANGVSRNGSNVTKSTIQHHPLRPAYLSSLGPEQLLEREDLTNNQLNSLLRSTIDAKITAAYPDRGQEIVTI